MTEVFCIFVLVDWTSEGCYNEKKKKKRLLKNRFRVVRKGINKKDPDVELMFSKCKAIAEKEGYEIFAIRVRPVKCVALID